MKQFTYNGDLYKAYSANEDGGHHKWAHVERADTGYVPMMRQKDIIMPLLMANGYPDTIRPKTTSELVGMLIKKLDEPGAVTSANGVVVPSTGSNGVFVVFQNSSLYLKEKTDGIIEAPKKDKSGKTPYHWKKLEDVKDKNIIFHMSDQKIKAVSVANGVAFDLDADHRAVKCTYHELVTSIDLSSYRSTLKAACKDVKNAPFNINGTGNQGYLFDLPNDLINLFATEAKKLNPEEDLSFLDDIGGAASLTSASGTGGTAMDIEEPDLELNMILYGPPGTGKTYNTKKYAVAICDGKKLKDYAEVPYSDIEKRYDALVAEKRITFTTFHQSYGYEDFIEGIRPKTKGTIVEYPVVPGVFKAFCDKAGSSDMIEKPCVFIIDEINRGNISKIFGELITLIEPSKRLGASEPMKVVLPYSESKIEFGVPKNVYILGTMNTADRSIAMMDTALRRRFSFVEMMPDTKILEKIGANKVSCDGKEVNVVDMLKKINDRIEVLFDREHTIGHAFFTVLTGTEATLHNLRMIFENKVIPLLQEYFYDDYEKIQLVLGDNQKSDEKYKFIKCETNNVKTIFKGNVDDNAIPEKKYSINKEAFKYIESYMEIY